ncbi:MAG: FecR family protein [Flavobacteriaceae bacterium]|nr:FecR family protein [Flavobacteriaceae bacterium]
METNYNNELFTRWLNDELSPEELREFEKSPKFSLYQKIAQKSSELDTPDFNEERVFGKIKSQLASQQRPTKVKKLFPKFIISAAASVVVLLGLFFFLNRTTSYSTSYGEQLAITLPDNSEVILNANSTLSYKTQNWKENRILDFNGEGYFKVEKGSDFVVESAIGTVSVLGTQFNVNTKDTTFEIKCFEGKVKVKTANHNRILTQGKAFRQLKDTTAEDFNILEILPSWTQGESNFNSAPLSQVIIALEHQYNIKIDASKIDITQRFTGSFTHNNLNVALQTVFVPLRINPSQVDTKNIVLVKQ